jgi:hypothetical protein
MQDFLLQAHAKPPDKCYDECNMPKLKFQPARPGAANSNVRRRWFRFFLWSLLVFLWGGAFYTSGGRLHLPGMNPDYHTLSELLATQKYRGFEVVQEPDRPGPYKDIGMVNAGRGEPVIATFWSIAGKRRSFNIPAMPGEELRVVGLAPESGGEATCVVLRPHGGTK